MLKEEHDMLLKEQPQLQKITSIRLTWRENIRERPVHMVFSPRDHTLTRSYHRYITIDPKGSTMTAGSLLITTERVTAELPGGFLINASCRSQPGGGGGNGA
jgi:hypothetical protein